MTVDDYTLDGEILAFLQAALGSMHDEQLIMCDRKLPDLLKGRHIHYPPKFE